MAGIYIHIPFCRNKCNYCDFYSSTNLLKKQGFTNALLHEINQRVDYLNRDTIGTIYFGGGTPSVLIPEELLFIVKHIKSLYNLQNEVEITLEANPDDLSRDYLNQIKNAGINRLSIGIQSFSDTDLKLMNRRHSAAAAIRAVEQAFFTGFTDISIDLIFGIPGQTLHEWKKNLYFSTQLPVNHISAYHLTYHEGTVFNRWLKTGKVKELTEDESIVQFKELFAITAEAGFEQYEISNFARNQSYSKHNTGYWKGEKYLGMGPSAHSFNGFSRQWNVSSLDTYITGIFSQKPVFSTEVLSEKDRLNEYIITGIRTKWGISMSHIREKFGEHQASKIFREVLKYQSQSMLEIKDGTVTLTLGGIFVSDQIVRDLIVE